MYKILGEEDTAELFELRQSIYNAPLTHHPENGKPVRRVISGGLGYLKVRSASNAFPPREAVSSCCPGCRF